MISQSKAHHCVLRARLFLDPGLTQLTTAQETLTDTRCALSNTLNSKRSDNSGMSANRSNMY